ncbi:MAG TPA: PIG-L deacetylase family protein [Nitrospinota bacterium]|jgi:LmbE family N-acetylglucosaminyl deacetylase|nr:PIG-L deacetylase family protein [Nitrospinota bacterium]MDP7661743.1 PIG-L deacetylase family protein [Nitrospinota bacterium]HJP14531.1 PIG-L deacetylase family protein [Nitrospinota bacterium]
MSDEILDPLPEEWSCALAIVAHPEDMESGAASAIARWTSQGKKVVYILMTSGEAGIDGMSPQEAGPIREEEEYKGASVVGVEKVDFLGYTDGVIEYGLPLRLDIARQIRIHKPEVLITLSHRLTWPGGPINMADHRWLAYGVMDGARDAGNRWIFTELLEEGFEPWPGVRMVLLSGSPMPTHAVDITGFLEKGVESLQEHRAYIENLAQGFDPVSFLTNSAELNGKRSGFLHAASFEVVNI